MSNNKKKTLENIKTASINSRATTAQIVFNCSTKRNGAKRLKLTRTQTQRMPNTMELRDNGESMEVIKPENYS